MCTVHSIRGGEQEVAYETAVLGRLRGGYRVFRLRSMNGTRIELCYLLARISFGSEVNEWATPRELRARSASSGAKQEKKLSAMLQSLSAENETLRQQVEQLTRGGDSRQSLRI